MNAQIKMRDCAMYFLTLVLVAPVSMAEPLPTETLLTQDVPVISASKVVRSSAPEKKMETSTDFLISQKTLSKSEVPPPSPKVEKFYHRPPQGWTQVADNARFFFHVADELDEELKPQSPKKMEFFDTKTGRLYFEGENNYRIFGYYINDESQIQSVSVPRHGKFAVIKLQLYDGRILTEYFHFESQILGSGGFMDFAIGYPGVINIKTGKAYPLMGYAEGVWAHAVGVSPDQQWINYIYHYPDSPELKTGLWNIKTGKKIELSKRLEGIQFFGTQRFAGKELFAISGSVVNEGTQTQSVIIPLWGAPPYYVNGSIQWVRRIGSQVFYKIVGPDRQNKILRVDLKKSFQNLVVQEIITGKRVAGRVRSAKFPVWI